jgi:superfamily I DNA and/or RNA helicase
VKFQQAKSSEIPNQFPQVSHCFYGGKLCDADTLGARGTFWWEKITNSAGQVSWECHSLPKIVVFNLQYGAAERKGGAQQNVSEAEATELIHKFVTSKCWKCESDSSENVVQIGGKDVCVLNPFNPHKDQLRMQIAGIEESELKDYEYMRDSRDEELRLMLGEHDQTTTIIRNIDTVDKFQGSEREVVIMNTVVDSAPARAGDPHFINVAISRSRSMLVLVGKIRAVAEKDWNWWKILEYAIRLEAETGAVDARVFDCKSLLDVRASLKSLTRSAGGSGGGNKRSNSGDSNTAAGGTKRRREDE